MTTRYASGTARSRATSALSLKFSPYLASWLTASLAKKRSVKSKPHCNSPSLPTLKPGSRRRHQKTTRQSSSEVAGEAPEPKRSDLRPNATVPAVDVHVSCMRRQRPPKLNAAPGGSAEMPYQTLNAFGTCPRPPKTPGPETASAARPWAATSTSWSTSAVGAPPAALGEECRRGILRPRRWRRGAFSAGCARRPARVMRQLRRFGPRAVRTSKPINPSSARFFAATGFHTWPTHEPPHHTRLRVRGRHCDRAPLHSGVTPGHRTLPRHRPARNHRSRRPPSQRV